MTERESPGASDAHTALTADFLTWLASGPKPYSEVMEAWRTSCPRLTIWEDAVADGLVKRRLEGRDAVVELSERGKVQIGAGR
jgi:hypothetical protein